MHRICHDAVDLSKQTGTTPTIKVIMFTSHVSHNSTVWKLNFLDRILDQSLGNFVCRRFTSFLQVILYFTADYCICFLCCCVAVGLIDHGYKAVSA